MTWEEGMKKIITVLVVFSLVLLSSFSTALTAQSDGQKALLGTWDVELISAGMAMEFVFKMEGEEFLGEMVFDMGSGEMEDIAIEEGTLTFTAMIDAGGQVIGIDAEATIEGDTMTGTMFTDMGDAEFTGTKRKDS
jgi:hypothetical protein